MRIHLVITFSLFLAAQGWAQDFTWPNSDKLTQASTYAPLYDTAQDIAHHLNSGSTKYHLVYKQKGGTSHQTLVMRDDGVVIGIWSPPNHATYILGEIFAFHLARLFNRGTWAAPAIRMTLSGAGRSQAYTALDTKAPNARVCNRDTILSYMNKNTEYINGAFMPFESGIYPEKIRELVDTNHTRRLQGKHFLVQMLNAQEAQPKNEAIYLTPNLKHQALSYKKSSESRFMSTDLELARQLSFMMLVDALNSQRDRFGPYGSNMEAMVNDNDGSFRLTLIDNGGIADSAHTISKKYFVGSYGQGVSRFEREVFEQVLALDDFMMGIAPSFEQYTSIDELKIALGYEDIYSQDMAIDKPNSCNSNHGWLFYGLKTRWDRRFKYFAQALHTVATYMREFENHPDAFFQE